MSYYTSIKNELINNEVYKKVKDYSKNRSDLKTYYNVGKMLNDAGKHYGEGIIKEYSKKLTSELGIKYTERTLRRMRQFYNFCKNQKWSPLATKLTWSHYIELLSIKDNNKINYYINQCNTLNLSRNELRQKIKSKEYERLSEETKEKLKNNEKLEIGNTIKEDNKFIIKYASDSRIYSSKYILI